MISNDKQRHDDDDAITDLCILIRKFGAQSFKIEISQPKLPPEIVCTERNYKFITYMQFCNQKILPTKGILLALCEKFARVKSSNARLLFLRLFVPRNEMSWGGPFVPRTVHSLEFLFTRPFFCWNVR